jgi:hypothetical protein
MSVSTADYIPFDYQRYVQEILPAFEQATQGDLNSLLALLASTTHIAYSVRTRYTVPLAGEEGQRFLRNRFHPDIASLLDVPTLRKAKAGGPWNPWESFTVVLPTLAGRALENLGKYGELLRSFLLATLCCELPPWSSDWPYRDGKSVIWHDEVQFDWQEYLTRDEQTQKLWEMFYQPLPQEIAQQQATKKSGPTEAFIKSSPRAISYASDEGIAGFLTHEEIEYLLQQVHVRAKPEARDALIDECIRDGEARGWSVEVEVLPPGIVKQQKDLSNEEFSYRIAGEQYISYRDLFTHWRLRHPVEMEALLQGYYQRVWTVEAEVLYRMRFAAARGWGMLQTYAN